MKIWLNRFGSLAALVFAASLFFGQTLPLVNGAAAASDSSVRGSLPRGALVREVDDPATGYRWLLERTPEHPGGPGRLVMVGSPAGNREDRTEPASARQPIIRLPVIRAGDAVTLVAHTTVMDAELEAVALAPAAVGAVFRARLKMGGTLVYAVAISSGNAEWSPNRGEAR